MGYYTQNWISRKSILVFGVSLKQMYINEWNFLWMIILAFSIFDEIFEIFEIFLSYLYTFSIINFVLFFSLNVNKILGKKAWQFYKQFLIYCCYGGVRIYLKIWKL